MHLGCVSSVTAIDKPVKTPIELEKVSGLIDYYGWRARINRVVETGGRQIGRNERISHQSRYDLAESGLSARKNRRGDKQDREQAESIN
jgi:hypothetical protein